MHPPREVDTGRDVAPLIAAADLQLTAVVLVEINEVVGLDEHVAELGVADAAVAVEAALHRVFGQHHVDRKMLADVAEETEIRKAPHPIVIVEQQSGCRPFELEQAAKLALDS